MPVTRIKVHGFIGVAPILFNKLDDLNSYIAWGIEVKDIAKTEMVNAPPIIM